MAVRTGHVHHRLPGFFFIIILLTYKKSPFFLRRTGTEKTFFCGTTLIAVQNGHLCPVPTHRLPVNAGNASEDTQGKAPFPLPSAAHLLPRFSLRSQPPELSVDAHLQLYSRICGFINMLCFLYTICVHLSRTFLRLVWTSINTPGRRP